MLKLFANLFFLYGVTEVAYTANIDKFIGQPCLPDPSDSTKIGQCVKVEDCDHGTFEPENNAPEVDNSNPISCHYKHFCCVPVKKKPAAKQECGWIQDGVGDAPPGLAKKREVPWTVDIFKPVGTSGANFKMQFLSNGVLIHDRAVLTVAHKATGFQDLVSSGLYAVVGNYDQREFRQSRKALKVTEVVVHESFDNETAEFDYALLILATSVRSYATLSHVAPACLPARGVEVDPGTRCFFTGWGKNEASYHQSKLTRTEVLKISREDCAAALQPYLADEYSLYVVSPSLTCAQPAGGGQPCKGDAGSPLVCPMTEPGRYQLVGLVAYVGDCVEGLPVVYADVALAREWIDNNLAAKVL